MSQKILSAKLSEMDTVVSQLHTRIQSCEDLSDIELESEIYRLKNEIEVDENNLRESIQSSKASFPEEIRDAIEYIHERPLCIVEKLHIDDCLTNDECSTEQKLLMAEYGIDFVMLVANHALLLALEAMQAQRSEID